MCSRCGITYNPDKEDVRHGTMIETLEGSIPSNNTAVINESLVSYPSDPNDKYTRKKPVDYRGGIGELAKRGSINITGYSEGNVEKEKER